MSEAIRFYCGVSERHWNYHPVEPGPYACVSPVYGRTLQGKRRTSILWPKYTRVIQDSGAFSDDASVWKRPLSDSSPTPNGMGMPVK